MARIQMLRAFHLYIYLFLFGIEQNPAQGSGKGIINRLLFLLQRNDSRFQAGGLNHSLHEKVQLIKLAGLCCQKFLLLLRGNLVFKQRVVEHLQVGNRGLDLMGDVRDQLLQVSPFFCDTVFIFLHDFVQPPQPVVDFIEQAFFLNRLLRLHIPGEHIIHLTTKGIGEPDQLPADQSHKEDNAEQHKETEQEHTPDSSYIPGQQIHSGANCTNRKQQEYSQKDTGFVDGEFSRIHFSAPPIHI